MKTNNQKQVYSTPEIVSILLDNEISLALASETPPDGPGETYNTTPEYLHNNPFNTNLG